MKTTLQSRPEPVTEEWLSARALKTLAGWSLPVTHGALHVLSIDEDGTYDAVEFWQVPDGEEEADRVLLIADEEGLTVDRLTTLIGMLSDA